MDVITEGKKIQNELVELRRYVHEHPELHGRSSIHRRRLWNILMNSEFRIRSPVRPA